MSNVSGQYVQCEIADTSFINQTTFAIIENKGGGTLFIHTSKFPSAGCVLPIRRQTKSNMDHLQRQTTERGERCVCCTPGILN